MSDTENVSVEVRELLELVLKEPVQSDINVTLKTSEPDNQSMDAPPEIPVNTNIDLQQKHVPILTERKYLSISPEPDLRLIESNALRLIAQYGSDSDSDLVESDNDTASSDEVVAIDDVEMVLQQTITDGNYRVVSSDSEERYVSMI